MKVGDLVRYKDIHKGKHIGHTFDMVGVICSKRYHSYTIKWIFNPPSWQPEEWWYHEERLELLTHHIEKIGE